MRKPRVFRRSWKDPGTGDELESEFYFLDYTDPRTGRRVIRRTSPPTGDERVAKDQLRAALRGEAPRGQRVSTGAEILDSYRAHLRAESPRFLYARSSALKWWEERWGRLPVDAIGPDQLTAARADVRGGRKPGTVRDYLNVLRSAFKRGVTAGTVPAGHCVAALRVSKRDKAEPRDSVWTDDEIARIRPELTPLVRSVFDVVLATGLRIGDALALRWESIGESSLRLTMGKTRRSLFVPLFPEAAELFRSFRPEPAAGLVWPDPEGQPWTYEVISRSFRRSRGRASIEGRTIHDLRRTFAVRLRRRGVPRDLVAPFLGHASTTMTAAYTPDEWETLLAVVARASESSGKHDDDGRA